MNTRRTFLDVVYEKTNITEDLRPHLKDWTYTDNLSGEVDDLNIVLEDRATRWLNSMFPNKGSTLTASIIKENWEGFKDKKKFKLGKFEIDTITAKGEPTEVTISALSVPESTSIRRECKSKAWENVPLSAVAGDIAGKNGLKLHFESSENPKKDRYEQDNETDLQFLQRMCADEGLCLKISNKNLVILDEQDYENKKAVGDIYRDNSVDTGIYVKSWEAISTVSEVFKNAKVEHHEGEKKIDIIATFNPPKMPKTGKTLVIKEEVKTQAEGIRLAKKRLREKNKEATRLELEVISRVHIEAGMNFNIKRFGKFNGKYIAYKVVHSGSLITLSLRKCLEGY